MISPKPTPYAVLQDKLSQRIRAEKPKDAIWAASLIVGMDAQCRADLRNVRRVLPLCKLPADRQAVEWYIRELEQIKGIKPKPQPKEPDAVVTVTAPPTVRPFVLHLPKKPYCADYLASGLKTTSQKQALKRRHIQHNGPGMIWTVALDIDHATDADTLNIEPRPNFIVRNPENQHCHAFFELAAGVCTTSAAQQKPMRYLASIEGALVRRFDADPRYSGLICKNPLHPDWELLEGHDHLYTLAELAAPLDLKAANACKFTAESASLGRNCYLFDEARQWAYKAIRQHWGPGKAQLWHEAVFEYVESLNRGIAEPLPFSEIKAIAKSIAKWTWTNTTPQGLQEKIAATHTPELQAERGRKSGASRLQAREEAREAAQTLWGRDGYTVREVAAMLGVPYQTIGRWVRDL